MFEDVFPLIGQSGAILVFASMVGVAATIGLTETLGAVFRGVRRAKSEPQQRERDQRAAAPVTGPFARLAHR